ncbi:hypothetical protein L9F63_009537 [Diploptera punctata]|uniref:Acylphosphatase n=1 Tax=Diploptera punctata TaxID=6984 RepID=A0AAD8AJD9_DIPPU|nr:hypothetical protein L9F63_009537 [Diploptera punctata]
MSSQLMSVDFEVYGKVQGVYFRKYTEQKARELNLRGWCMNTDKGTVTGKLEGSREKIEEMKKWLTNVGSPKSKIDKAEFKNEQTINKSSFKQFDIRR